MSQSSESNTTFTRVHCEVPHSFENSKIAPGRYLPLTISEDQTNNISSIQRPVNIGCEAMKA